MENKRGFVFVNLMPFREQIKKDQMKQFYMILGFFSLIAVLFTFVTYSFVNVKIDNQQARNSYMKKENEKLDTEIKEISNLQAEINDTLGKRKVVEGLQVNRVDAVNIVNEVATQLPEGMKITSVTSKVNGKNDVVTVKGTTNSNNKVSAYMTQLVDSNVFVDPRLIEIKANDVVVDKKKNVANQSVVDSSFQIDVVLKEAIDEEMEVSKSSKDKK